MYTEATPYAIRCPEHGEQFITKELFDKGIEFCPIEGCNKSEDCEFDMELHKLALITGCHYCKKLLIDSLSFIYDEVRKQVFCHVPCLKCYQRRCTVRRCPGHAKWAMYLIIGKDEYIVPCSFCEAHVESIPKIIDDSMLGYLKTLTGNQDLAKEDCLVKMVEY